MTNSIQAFQHNPLHQEVLTKPQEKSVFTRLAAKFFGSRPKETPQSTKASAKLLSALSPYRATKSPSADKTHKVFLTQKARRKNQFATKTARPLTSLPTSSHLQALIKRSRSSEQSIKEAIVTVNNPLVIATMKAEAKKHGVELSDDQLEQISGDITPKNQDQSIEKIGKKLLSWGKEHLFNFRGTKKDIAINLLASALFMVACAALGL